MNSRLSTMGWVLGMGLLMGSARAQAPAPPPEPQAPATGIENVPDPDKLQSSTKYLTQMRQGLKLVLSKLEEARSGKDVVKLNCVNEKLTNIKGLLRISEQADISLQEAVARREEQTAQHEFAKVTIARQKVEQLKAEAEQCVGMLAFETGPTEVTVEVPTDLPQADPTLAPPPSPVASRAPAASPPD